MFILLTYWFVWDQFGPILLSTKHLFSFHWFSFNLNIIVDSFVGTQQDFLSQTLQLIRSTVDSAARIKTLELDWKLKGWLELYLQP